MLCFLNNSQTMITQYCFGLTLFIIIPVFKHAVYVNADNSLLAITRNRSGRKSGKSHNEFYGNDRTLFPKNYYDDASRKWERIDKPSIARRNDRRYKIDDRRERIDNSAIARSNDRRLEIERYDQKTFFGGTEVIGGSYVDTWNDQVEGLSQARPEDVLEVFDAMKPFFQKHMTKMLIAYKIKFFLLIPILVGGLLLIIGSSSLAGLFFAMFVIGVWSRT